MKSNFYIVVLLICVFGISCKKDKPKITTPYTLKQPYKFPIFPEEVNENITEEGIKLGRKLFYDPILSGDNSMSCATCHVQKDGFSDKRKFSEGIDDSLGERQAMPIINIAWATELFWDGRAEGIHKQALEPVENPIEMKANWKKVVEKLQKNIKYVEMFDNAFPDKEITKELAVNAISQFEKTLISSNSKFDDRLQGKYTFTEQEQRGYELFFSEQADCFHCHSGALFTDLLYHNNGLDATHTDLGRENFTENANDRGKFKTPTLRNISFTAPYMHDGRFETLDQVLDFYSTGVKSSSTLDPLMEFSAQGGVTLDSLEKEDLKAFLLLLNDEKFINNKDFSALK